MQINKRQNSPVDDTELLYRRVRAGKGLYRFENGLLIFSSQAFNDKKLEPSVDRAILCGNNPEHTKFDKTDGVITLLTSTIRKEKISVDDKKGCAVREYAIDVVPRPTKNIAHAVIIPNPKYHDDRDFKKVQKSLAILANKAGWTIEPTEN